MKKLTPWMEGLCGVESLVCPDGDPMAHRRTSEDERAVGGVYIITSFKRKGRI